MCWHVDDWGKKQKQKTKKENIPVTSLEAYGLSLNPYLSLWDYCRLLCTHVEVNCNQYRCQMQMQNCSIS